MMAPTEQEYGSGVHDARLTLRAWLGGNMRMLFGDDADVMWPWCLAHNLAMAAFGCRSFELGAGVEIGEWTRTEGERWVSYVPPQEWKPGCQKAAP